MTGGLRDISVGNGGTQGLWGHKTKRSESFGEKRTRKGERKHKEVTVTAMEERRDHGTRSTYPVGSEHTCQGGAEAVEAEHVEEQMLQADMGERAGDQVQQPPLPCGERKAHGREEAHVLHSMNKEQGSDRGRAKGVRGKGGIHLTSEEVRVKFAYMNSLLRTGRCQRR